MADERFQHVTIPPPHRALARGLGWGLIGAGVALLAVLALVAVIDAAHDPSWMRSVGLVLALGGLALGAAAMGIGIRQAARPGRSSSRA